MEAGVWTQHTLVSASSAAIIKSPVEVDVVTRLVVVEEVAETEVMLAVVEFRVPLFEVVFVCVVVESEPIDPDAAVNVPPTLKLPLTVSLPIEIEVVLRSVVLRLETLAVVAEMELADPLTKEQDVPVVVTAFKLLHSGIEAAVMVLVVMVLAVMLLAVTSVVVTLVAVTLVLGCAVNAFTLASCA